MKQRNYLIKGGLFGKNKSKGFLFTISVILFASTLVFFAQSFSITNNLVENTVFSKFSPMQVVQLGDDLAFDFLRISELALDVNYASSSKVSISGTINPPSTLATDFDNYSYFLSDTFFPRGAGTETLNLSNTSDGDIELFFGSVLEFDYNYDVNAIYLVNLVDAEMSEIDLNFFSSGSIVDYSWSESAGSMVVDINYYDDTNYLHFTKSFDPEAESTLTINYADGSVIIYFGLVNSTNSSFAIESSTPNKIDYSFDSFFAGTYLMTPIRANALFSYSRTGINYSNDLVLVK